MTKPIDPFGIEAGNIAQRIADASDVCMAVGTEWAEADHSGKTYQLNCGRPCVGCAVTTTHADNMQPNFLPVCSYHRDMYAGMAEASYGW